MTTQNGISQAAGVIAAVCCALAIASLCQSAYRTVIQIRGGKPSLQAALLRSERGEAATAF